VDVERVVRVQKHRLFVVQLFWFLFGGCWSSCEVQELTQSDVAEVRPRSVDEVAHPFVGDTLSGLASHWPELYLVHFSLRVLPVLRMLQHVHSLLVLFLGGQIGQDLQPGVLRESCNWDWHRNLLLNWRLGLSTQLDQSLPWPHDVLLGWSRSRDEFEALREVVRVLDDLILGLVGSTLAALHEREHLVVALVVLLVDVPEVANHVILVVEHVLVGVIMLEPVEPSPNEVLLV